MNLVEPGSGKFLAVKYTMHHHSLVMTGLNRAARGNSCNRSVSTHGIFALETK